MLKLVLIALEILKRIQQSRRTIKVTETYQSQCSGITYQDALSKYEELKKSKKHWLMISNLKKALPANITNLKWANNPNEIKNEYFLIINEKWINLKKIKSSNITTYLIEKEQKVKAKCLEEEPDAFKRTLKLKVEPYTRQFQFKILHNIVATNSILHKWKIVSIPAFSYCQIQRETVDHLLYECIPVRELWRKIQDWWNATVKPPKNLKLGNKEKKYGIENKSQEDILLNILLIETRISIFKNREKYHIPEITQIISKLRTRKDVEKQTKIFKMNYEKRWSPLQDKI